MKILVIADVECKAYWDFFRKSDFEGIDLIISCGDLDPQYLSFLVTMVPVPLLYVHGNHDDCYEKTPPEGCTCIENRIFLYEGVRILGLGGSMRYKHGKNQYTEAEMKHRIEKLWVQLWYRKGFDILVTHAPAKGINDGKDLCHHGFEAFLELLDKYSPRYFLHGHVHLTYGRIPREAQYKETRVINAYDHYIIEI